MYAYCQVYGCIHIEYISSIMQTVSVWFVLFWLYHLFPVDACKTFTHIFMMTSSNGNIFRVTGHLCGEFTGHRWIPCTKTSDADLWCFLWSAPWINCWVYNREAGDLRRQRAHCDGRHFNVSGSLYLCGIVTNSSEVTLKHWKRNFIILIKSLTALEVVKMTTSSTASDGNFVTLKIFPFQWGQFNTK